MERDTFKGTLTEYELEALSKLLSLSTQPTDVTSNSSRLRNAIIRWIEENKDYDKTTLSELSRLPSVQGQTGVTRLTKSTVYRLLDEKRPFTPRKRTAELLREILGDDFFEKFTLVEESALTQTGPVYCDSCFQRFNNLNVMYISQLLDKGLGYVRASIEHQHEVIIHLCSQCLPKQKNILKSSYSELMKQFVSLVGHPEACKTLNIDSSTLHRIESGAHNIFVIRKLVAQKLHALLLSSRYNPMLVGYRLFNQQSSTQEDINVFFPPFMCHTDFDSRNNELIDVTLRTLSMKLFKNGVKKFKYTSLTITNCEFLSFSKTVDQRESVHYSMKVKAHIRFKYIDLNELQQLENTIKHVVNLISEYDQSFNRFSYRHES